MSAKSTIDSPKELSDAPVVENPPDTDELDPEEVTENNNDRKPEEEAGTNTPSESSPDDAAETPVSIQLDASFLPAIHGPALSKDTTKIVPYQKNGSIKNENRSCCCACNNVSPCLKIFATVFSTSLVVLYGVGGAILFSRLENKSDIDFSVRVDKYKNDTAIQLATELRQVSAFEDVWAKKVFQYLELYEKDLLKASSQGYRTQDDPDRGQSWTFYSALFFSFSLMTTTGSGHTMPRSEWSHAIVMGYSVVGIPLLVTWLATTGRNAALFWCYIFQRICCNLCNTNGSRVFPHPPSSTKAVKDTGFNVIKFTTTLGTGFGAYAADCFVVVLFPLLLLIVYFVLGSTTLSFLNEWSVSDSFYFNFAMFMTLGPGCGDMGTRMTTVNTLQSPFYMTYWLLGICMLSVLLNLIYILCSRNLVTKKRCASHNSGSIEDKLCSQFA